jgi:hypothetical protein
MSGQLHYNMRDTSYPDIENCVMTVKGLKLKHVSLLQTLRERFMLHLYILAQEPSVLPCRILISDFAHEILTWQY